MGFPCALHEGERDASLEDTHQNIRNQINRKNTFYEVDNLLTKKLGTYSSNCSTIVFLIVYWNVQCQLYMAMTTSNNCTLAFDQCLNLT